MGGRSIEYRLRDPIEDVKRHYTPLRPYAPLLKSDLVVDLAECADEPITPQAVVDWAQTYGLLDCSWEEDVVEGEDPTGERIRIQGAWRRDSVERFEEAAREVRACLRMYEAANRKGPVNLDELSMSLGPLPPAFGEVLQRWKRHKTVERPWLYGVIGDLVQMRLRDHCYPKLVIFTRGGNPSGRFGLSYGFNNLLGAIWFLMAQLLDSRDVTYCRLPDCGRVSNLCQGNHSQQTRRKGRVRATRLGRTQSSALAKSGPADRSTGTAKRRDGLVTIRWIGSAYRLPTCTLSKPTS